MSHPGDIEQEQLLDRVIAAYLQALDAGQQPDRVQILVRYPDIASQLNEFFSDQDLFGEPPASLGLLAHDGLRLRPAEPRREEFCVGSVIAGRYRVFDIKRGGMGRVYLADDLDSSTDSLFPQVAIKAVPDFLDWSDERASRGALTDLALYGDNLARFRREAISWVRLGFHPNIISALEVLDIGAKPYLIMEYADGGDLRSLLREGGLTLPVAVNLAIQFCRGMKHAADTLGLVHRDIKPSNVLLKEDHILKIADFGLAKVFMADTESDSGRVENTQVGACGYPRWEIESTLSALGFGTHAYMAPEQFRNFRNTDTRSDVFSFGAMFFEMLTGEQLFCGPFADKMAAQNVRIPFLQEVKPSISRDVSAVVARCLRYDPQHRYQSFGDIAYALLQINETLQGALPLQEDQRTIAADALTPSIQVLGEAYSLISLGQYAEAVRCAQRGIDIDGGNHEHWVNKGKALGELKDFNAAQTCFERATELRPVDARAWANLAWTTLVLGDTAAAVSHATRATQLDERLCDGWLALGACERALGRISDALASLGHATCLEPYNWKAQANLGFCLLELQNAAGALSALRRAADINPHDALVWYHIGWLLSAAGQGLEAGQAIDKSLELDRSSANAWGLRALLLWKEQRDLDGARASLAEALRLEPYNEKAQAVISAMEKPVLRQRPASLRRGGLGEPYCSERCYDSAGKDIAAANLRGYNGPCNFCQCPVRLGLGSGNFAHRFRKNFLYVCHRCRSQAEAQARDILECCFCGCGIDGV
jgi:serine/threonine protein kinase/cytochrome c-type biogenesis protein CcmH/NrfG